MKSGREHFQIRLEGGYLQNIGFSQHTRHILRGFLQHEDTYHHWLLIRPDCLTDSSSMGDVKWMLITSNPIHSEALARLFAEVIWHFKKEKQNPKNLDSLAVKLKKKKCIFCSAWTECISLELIFS